MNFPQARREFSDAGGRMLADTLQYINEIGVGIDALQSAGHNQALDNADVFSTELGPTKEPGLALIEVFR